MGDRHIVSRIRKTAHGKRSPRCPAYNTENLRCLPTPHGVASTQALENACKTSVPNNARILRNVVLACNFIQSHILSFYHLSLLDFVNGAKYGSMGPGWTSDKRLAPAKEQQLFSNYVKALDITRKTQEMGAIFGGRLPHSPAYVAGGFTRPLQAQISQISKPVWRKSCHLSIPFISPMFSILHRHIPTTMQLAKVSPICSRLGFSPLDQTGGPKC